ncbi:MAG: hypothetical protein QFX38_07415 [Methanothermobacter sp.]|nr:hypothetical protein [Methanothermobacter sp.]
MHWTISMLEMIGIIGSLIGALGLLIGKRLAFLFCGFISSALLAAIYAIESDVWGVPLPLSFSFVLLYWIGKVKGMKWTETRIFQVTLTIIT